ncbi:MAG: hypothetical protein BGN82_03105 [Alphaproteobacteria bacterium 65-7]|mgnify:FL=1|nr:MAG: hypothetical protein BGN82_03105 [Alphaproteobacteria bacterium 65-7]
MSIASTQEYNAVIDVLHKYLEGSNGNVELLKEAFHDNAIINGRPIQALYDAVVRKGQINSTSRVDYLDIVGNVASARTVIENWHGYNFVEYQHLVKDKNGWKITSKTYTEIKLD